MNSTLPRAERRKQVRLRRRPDLVHTTQRYEGNLSYVIKDPVSLKYYRLSEQEYFVFSHLDGVQTLEDVQKAFEQRFRPDRVTLEELEGFARELVTGGLVHHESQNSAEILFEKREEQRWMKKLSSLTNILYIKIPIIDPDRVLSALAGRLSWIFTTQFLFVSLVFMLAAAAQVTLRFQVFWDKLPAYQDFLRLHTLLYMWLAMGIVKVIHEFGHGLSCKAFGGECHEMGVLLMCFSPAMYCNVTDSWTMTDKWKRIIISFAGIYVELIMAAFATWVWWYTPHWPFVNNVALCLMVLCSVSTFMFNANPLMRFDGYYILADWMEVPNLRERSNRYLTDRFQETALGMEVTPERYMAAWRRWFFVAYTIASTIYRWVLTVTILFFLAKWLKPYKLETLSILLALAALGSQFGWPLYRMIRNIRKRGRMPDMKRNRVIITTSLAVALLVAFFFVPLPINRVRETGLVQVQENCIAHLYVGEPGGYLMVQYVQDGDWVTRGKDLATFSNPKQESKVAQLRQEVDLLEEKKKMMGAQIKTAGTDVELKNRYMTEMAQVGGKLAGTVREWERESKLLEELMVLHAPRDGMVMGAPNKDKQFRYWDKSESERFCSIGDPSKMRLLVPVTPPEYRELKENLVKRQKENPDEPAHLDVSILLANRSDKIYQGRVTVLPDSHETNVPVGLTSKGGGPLATKATQTPNTYEPVAQTYLVQVEVMDPDSSITPGTLGTVKIHLQWRTAAWWVGQKIASALDWGLW